MTLSFTATNKTARDYETETQLVNYCMNNGLSLSVVRTNNKTGYLIEGNGDAFDRVRDYLLAFGGSVA